MPALRQPLVARVLWEDWGGTPADGIRRGILEPSWGVFDFTYGCPAAEVPGYRSELHEDVEREAKVFLGKFFDHKAERVKARDVEVRTYADKYWER